MLCRYQNHYLAGIYFRVNGDKLRVYTITNYGCGDYNLQAFYKYLHYVKITLPHWAV